MKKLLVPVDLTSQSENSLRFAVNIAERSGGELTLLNVRHVPVPAADGTVITVEEDLKKGEADLRRLKSDLVYDLETNGRTVPKIQTRVVEGFAVDVIVESAVELGVDMIVMGTEGAKGIDEVLRGTKTSDVISKTDCPVFVVPTGAEWREISRIVYAADWLDSDEKTLQQLKALAEVYGAVIDVVHVVGAMNQVQVDRKDKAEAAYLDEVDYDKIFFHLVEGHDIQDSIMKYVEEHGAEVVAMLTKRRNFFQKLFNPSFTRKVVMYSDVPLLVFHS